MADPKLLGKMTKEEATYIAGLGPKLLYDMHNSPDPAHHTQAVVPLSDEEKAQRLLDYRQSKANKVAQAERAAARQAVLDRLGLSEDDLKALGL